MTASYRLTATAARDFKDQNVVVRGARQLLQTDIPPWPSWLERHRSNTLRSRNPMRLLVRVRRWQGELASTLGMGLRDIWFSHTTDSRGPFPTRDGCELWVACRNRG